MGDRLQRAQGKTNETVGKAKVKASKSRLSKSTGSKGVAQHAKGRTQTTVGKARRAAKNATS